MRKKEIPILLALLSPSPTSSKHSHSCFFPSPQTPMCTHRDRGKMCSSCRIVNSTKLKLYDLWVKKIYFSATIFYEKSQFQELSFFSNALCMLISPFHFLEFNFYLILLTLLYWNVYRLSPHGELSRCE